MVMGTGAGKVGQAKIPASNGDRSREGYCVQKSWKAIAFRSQVCLKKQKYSPGVMPNSIW